MVDDPEDSESERRTGGFRYTRDDILRARTMYEANGWSASRIATSMGADPETVMSWARDGRWAVGGVPGEGSLKARSGAAAEIAEDFERMADEQRSRVPERKIRRGVRTDTMRAAEANGIGRSWQMGKARYLAESRLAVIVMEKGVEYIPVDPATFDPKDNTFMLYDGSRIPVHMTVPDTTAQHKALVLIARMSGMMLAAEGEARVESKLWHADEGRKADAGEKVETGVVVNIHHPGASK